MPSPVIRTRFAMFWSWPHAIAHHQDRIPTFLVLTTCRRWSWTHATARHQDPIRHVLVLDTCHRPPSGPDPHVFGLDHMPSLVLTTCRRPSPGPDSHVLALTTCRRPPSGPNPYAFGPGYMPPPAIRARFALFGPGHMRLHLFRSILPQFRSWRRAGISYSALAVVLGIQDLPY